MSVSSMDKGRGCGGSEEAKRLSETLRRLRARRRGRKETDQMAWAVLVFALVVACLYIALDTVLPSSLRKRRKRPVRKMAHERDGE